MSESPQQPLDLTSKMHFHLVLADVIFETKRGGITSHRTQFMTQSSVNEFPADRIHQLQNSAAHTVKQKIGPGRSEGFKVHDVLFLHMHYCGHLSHEEFYGKGMTAPAEIQEADTSSVTNPIENGPTPASDLASVSDGETATNDNVVPFDRDR